LAHTGLAIDAPSSGYVLGYPFYPVMVLQIDRV
jgi:hypothetical protein